MGLHHAGIAGRDRATASSRSNGGSAIARNATSHRNSGRRDAALGELVHFRVASASLLPRPTRSSNVSPGGPISWSPAASWNRHSDSSTICSWHPRCGACSTSTCGWSRAAAASPGNVLPGVPGGKQHQRHRPDRPGSTLGQAGQARRDGRSGQFEKTAFDEPVGVLAANRFDQLPELGLPGRIARAMADQQQTVEFGTRWAAGLHEQSRGAGWGSGTLQRGAVYCTAVAGRIVGIWLQGNRAACLASLGATAQRPHPAWLGCYTAALARENRVGPGQIDFFPQASADRCTPISR